MTCDNERLINYDLDGLRVYIDGLHVYIVLTGLRSAILIMQRLR
jgi:hypothetical protein